MGKRCFPSNMCIVPRSRASGGHSLDLTSGIYVKRVMIVTQLGKFVIWGGISSDIRSEMLFYGDAS